jgi:hypothetical protein
MKNKIEFYLSSSEYETWQDVRKCRVIEKISGPRERGYWWIKVDPPVPATLCGGTEEVEELVLAERYKEDDLSKLGDEAISVYVCRILNSEAVRNKEIKEEDIDLVAWAEIALRPDLLP